MSEGAKRLLVTGWRYWDDEASVRSALQDARDQVGSDAVLVQGECPFGGADYWAARIWAQWGGVVESHPADFAGLGRKAGPLRNQEMVDAGADLCVAFLHPTSRGTVDCVRRAQVAGIPVWVMPWDTRTLQRTDPTAAPSDQHGVTLWGDEDPTAPASPPQPTQP